MEAILKKKKKRKFKIVSIIFSIIIVLLLAVFITLKMTFLKSFPELTGDPEIGKWYRVTPEGTKSSDGSEWHGIFRKGTENKVVVYFFGGGVSINDETSKGGKEFFATNMMGQDFVAQLGIGSDIEKNPFKDWSFLVIPYASGDFHTGTGEYTYTEDGKEKTVYHQGYTNYSNFVNEAKKYIDEPDTLLVTGFSAGAFATSLLADDVIDRFQFASNVTVAVDSALILYDDWNKTAVNLWKSPEKISEPLKGNNIVLDSLNALYQKRGDRVKILFDSSYRDDTLLQYQSYIDSGKMANTKELGDQYQSHLKTMVGQLQEDIPGIGIYIWSLKEDPKTQNTQHTILNGDPFDSLGNEKSIIEWIDSAVNGQIENYGLELLDKSL